MSELSMYQASSHTKSHLFISLIKFLEPCEKDIQYNIELKSSSEIIVNCTTEHKEGMKPHFHMFNHYLLPTTVAAGSQLKREQASNTVSVIKTCKLLFSSHVILQ